MLQSWKGMWDMLETLDGEGEKRATLYRRIEGYCEGLGRRKKEETTASLPPAVDELDPSWPFHSLFLLLPTAEHPPAPSTAKALPSLSLFVLLARRFLLRTRRRHHRVEAQR